MAKVRSQPGLTDVNSYLRSLERTERAALVERLNHVQSASDLAALAKQPPGVESDVVADDCFLETLGDFPDPLAVAIARAAAVILGRHAEVLQFCETIGPPGTPFGLEMSGTHHLHVKLPRDRSCLKEGRSGPCFPDEPETDGAD